MIHSSCITYKGRDCSEQRLHGQRFSLFYFKCHGITFFFISTCMCDMCEYMLMFVGTCASVFMQKPEADAEEFAQSLSTLFSEAGSLN